MLRFILCTSKGDLYCVLYFCRPVQQNVHRSCEPESETLLVVTRGELLAIWMAGNLKGKILSSAVGKFKFFCLQI